MVKKSISISIKEHVLIPKHKKLSEASKKKILEKFNITVAQLPKIRGDDPAIIALDVRPGDVIEVTRSSLTAGETIYYRGVSDE